jgi:hypothetical protein
MKAWWQFMAGALNQVMEYIKGHTVKQQKQKIVLNQIPSIHPKYPFSITYKSSDIDI